jgi:uncharacterized protein (TIGR03435 family)
MNKVRQMFMMALLSSLTFALWCVAVTTAQMKVTVPSPGPKIGDAPPEIVPAKMLQTPDGARLNWASLKGKVVVLEFWAIWCSPCMPAIDHLNDLSQKLAGQPVQFIAVSPEDEQTVTKFLVHKPIKGWVGLDPEANLFKAYGIGNDSRIENKGSFGIPHTIVIDQQGKIAAITRPEEVTETVIRQLLNQQAISLPTKEVQQFDLKWDEKGTEEKNSSDALSQVIIKPSARGGVSSTNPKTGKFVADGLPIEPLLQIAYQRQRSQIINNLPPDKQYYRVSVTPPDNNPETTYRMLRQALETTFRFTSHIETKPMQVLVLRRIEGAPTLKPSAGVGTGEHRTVSGHFDLPNSPVSMLAKLIGSFATNLPVIDETGLKDKYDFVLEYTPGDKESFITGLKKLGLEAIKVERAAEVLVLDPVK